MLKSCCFISLAGFHLFHDVSFNLSRKEIRHGIHELVGRATSGDQSNGKSIVKLDGILLSNLKVLHERSSWSFSERV